MTDVNRNGIRRETALRFAIVLSVAVILAMALSPKDLDAGTYYLRAEKW